MTGRRLSFTIAVLCAFAILLSLGTWQLERRAWKNDLVGRLEAGLTAPPRLYQPGKPELSHVILKGAFVEGATMKLLVPTPEAVHGKTQEGFGYQLFSPMTFEGRIVFVNRGFVPEGLAERMSPPPSGEMEVSGLVRLSRGPGWFTPPPEPAKHLFFDADIPAMARAAGLAGANVIEGEYIQADQSSAAPDWPLAGDPRTLLASIPNRHLEYALTWFGLAAALAGVYAAFMLRY